MPALTDSKDVAVGSSEWTLITTYPQGSLYVRYGAEVMLTQAESKPTTEIENTAILDNIRFRKSLVYFAVPAGSNIYGRTVAGASIISDTPAIYE